MQFRDPVFSFFPKIPVNRTSTAHRSSPTHPNTIALSHANRRHRMPGAKSCGSDTAPLLLEPTEHPVRCDSLYTDRSVKSGSEDRRQAIPSYRFPLRHRPRPYPDFDTDRRNLKSPLPGRFALPLARRFGESQSDTDAGIERQDTQVEPAHLQVRHDRIIVGRDFLTGQPLIVTRIDESSAYTQPADDTEGVIDRHTAPAVHRRILHIEHVEQLIAVSVDPVGHGATPYPTEISPRPNWA